MKMLVVGQYMSACLHTVFGKVIIEVVATHVLYGWKIGQEFMYASRNLVASATYPPK